MWERKRIMTDIIVGLGRPPYKITPYWTLRNTPGYGPPH